MPTTPFRQVAPDFFVAPQLQEEDFAAARAQGIRTVINNRPNGEAADQLSDAEARANAEAAGLAYAFVPVVSGGLRPEDIEAFAAAVAAHEGPYLAYCRSGTRSCFLWGLAAAASRPVPEILAAAADAGYDLRPALPLMRQRTDAAGG
jgi:sulfide:quinone oxidoreductase